MTRYSAKGPETVARINALERRAVMTAIIGLKLAIMQHARHRGQAAKDEFARTKMLPFITNCAPLAIRLGYELYDENMKAAKAALARFTASQAELDAAALALPGPAALFGWIDAIERSAEVPAGDAVSFARITQNIFLRVQAASAGLLPRSALANFIFVPRSKNG